MKKLLLALFLVFTLPLSAEEQPAVPTCLLYTSDAADEL